MRRHLRRLESLEQHYHARILGLECPSDLSYPWDRTHRLSLVYDRRSPGTRKPNPVAIRSIWVSWPPSNQPQPCLLDKISTYSCLIFITHWSMRLSSDTGGATREIIPLLRVALHYTPLPLDVRAMIPM